MDYVSQLREGILEAYTGIVTGLKNTEKGKIQHSSSIMRAYKIPCIPPIS
jgi:importin subunit beta-1